jgi:hypothetical protein
MATKDQIAQGKARAGGNNPIKVTPKQLKSAALNAAMIVGPGKYLKGARLARTLLSSKKDKEIVDAMKFTAKYNKRMAKEIKAEAKVTSIASARTRANIDKMEKSGNYKKTTVTPKKSSVKPESAKPTREQTLRADRARDLKKEKYRASLSKERKPLSKEPRLSNETKKLLEKFQIPVERPPSTKTTLGGQIGEARPLAKGQRLEAFRNEFKKRPVSRSRVNPDDIKAARIAKAIENKKARLEATKKPTKPAPAKTKQKLSPNAKRSKNDNRAEKQDLEGDRDIQTVRGKEYPDGYTRKPQREDKTIESRTSQNPESRGKNVDREAERYNRKQDVREKENDKKLAEQLKLAGKTYFPKSNPNKRLPQRTLEDRLVQLKKQARGKRAAANAAEVKRKANLAKLTPAQRLKVKKAVLQTKRNSKK